ncbi:hypothetical protein SAMN04487866_1236 [Thermoactinomyces sp. DSM 45891]|uniref:DUF6445 family protein n=1 Tax=Thermoactinomyces sp. DSM 45891 TaxID=1761907 RepID=UPI0009218014|nr:DUF6445 family protein [Thermoactinomyces sp. DSM 45891]SFX75964.1 hypothetical protein SAMN04487866_1236 [Thermoactinomyces sp. DSM 45891]
MSRIDQMGDRNKMIIVTDNFYADPDLVRSFALDATYSSGAQYNYPGYQSKKRLVNANALKESFERILGKKIEYNIENFGSFRIMTKESGDIINVHVDATDWAGLVFLAPNAPADAGMGIFRHRETGLMSPPSDKEARKKGFEDAQEYENLIVHRDKTNRELWELVQDIEPVYNRLVLIRGNSLYHAPIRGFGDNSNNSRLTHNFFFNEAMF